MFACSCGSTPQDTVLHILDTASVAVPIWTVDCCFSPKIRDFEAVPFLAIVDVEDISIGGARNDVSAAADSNAIIPDLCCHLGAYCLEGATLLIDVCRDAGF